MINCFFDEEEIPLTFNKSTNNTEIECKRIIEPHQTFRSVWYPEIDDDSE